MSCVHSILCFANSALGPIPESLRSLGVSRAPVQIMTSLEAKSTDVSCYSIHIGDVTYISFRLQ